MSDLLEQLRKAVGDSNVVAGDAVHADYTHDETLGATPQVPLALVLPGSTAEVVEVLRLANEQGVPVIARGSGTGLSGRRHPGGRRHPAGLRPHEPHPRDRHREPGRRGRARA